MFRRLLNPLKTNSFFLFGARGTGKSTLIREMLGQECGKNYLEINLLDPLIFEEATFGLESLVSRINSAAEQGIYQ